MRCVFKILNKCPCDGTNLIYAAIYFFGPAILSMALGIMSKVFKTVLDSWPLIGQIS